MGSIMTKAMRMGKYSNDIPQLTEYLATNETFIKYALQVNKKTNKGLTRFQKFLHDSAFPEDIDKNNSHSHKAGGSIGEHKDHHKK